MTTTSRHTPSSLACFSWIPTSRKPKVSRSFRLGLFSTKTRATSFQKPASSAASMSAFIARVPAPRLLASLAVSRSEERRVGKECRSLCDWSSDVCSSDLDTRDEFPEACLFRRFHERIHRQGACSAASGLAGGVYGELGHAGVARAGAVGRRVGEGDHLPFYLYHHDWVSPIKRGLYLPCLARAGLERRDALLDALVVDACNGFRVFQTGCSGLQDRSPQFFKIIPTA